MSTAAFLTDPTYNGTPVNDGTDIGGWEVYTPKPMDTSVYPLNDKRQPGSRIRYISTTGVDTPGGAADYFWDAANGRIVDSTGSATGAGAVAYGNDPFNPTGPVKPYRSFAYCGPCRFGGDIGDGDQAGYTTFSTGIFANDRLRASDWWLFKRGNTFDLRAEFGAHDNQSLAIPGSGDDAYPQIVGPYGPLATNRPKFVHPDDGFVNRGGGPLDWQNVRYLSLEFNGHDRPAGGGANYTAVTATAVASVPRNVIFEDCLSDGCNGGFNFANSGANIARRCVVLDSFSPSNTGHVQGIFCGGKAYTFYARLEDCILARNGFTNGNPSLIWPPNGTTLDWDPYSKNIYWTGPADHSKNSIVNTLEPRAIRFDRVLESRAISSTAASSRCKATGATRSRTPASFGTTCCSC
jgi:hypothetical protein